MAWMTHGLGLSCGLVWCGHYGAKLLEKTIAVFAYESIDSFGRVGAYDEAGVMMAIEAPYDLGCVVGAGVGVVLAREADDASGVALLWFR